MSGRQYPEWNYATAYVKSSAKKAYERGPPSKAARIFVLRRGNYLCSCDANVFSGRKYMAGISAKMKNEA